MQTSENRRGVRWAIVAALAVGLLGTALVGGIAARGGGDSDALGFKLNSMRPGASEKELAGNWQGVEKGGSGGEAFEALTAATQWAGAHGAGHRRAGRLRSGVHAADGPAVGRRLVVGRHARPVRRGRSSYRDYYSNSSGGAGSRHRSRHGPGGRRRRARLRGRRRRRRLALVDRAAATGRRSRTRSRRLSSGALELDRRRRALVRDGRGEHRRHELRRQRRLPARRTRRPARSRREPRRRRRARVDDDQRRSASPAQGRGSRRCAASGRTRDGDDRTGTLSLVPTRRSLPTARRTTCRAATITRRRTRTRRTRTSSTTSRSTRRTRTT